MLKATSKVGGPKMSMHPISPSPDCSDLLDTSLTFLPMEGRK